MADEFSSVNDPLFFMHHANIDRLWWMWQEKHPERVFDVDGPYMPWGVGPGGVRSDVKTNLSSLVELYPFVGATVPAKKIMDTLNRNGEGDLCYTYL
jgi:tyrosinase